MARARWYPTAPRCPTGASSWSRATTSRSTRRASTCRSRTARRRCRRSTTSTRNTWTPLNAGPAPDAAVPVHVRAARRQGVRRRPGPDDAHARHHDRPVDDGRPRATIDGHSAVMYRPGKILKSGTWADPDYPGITSTNRAATIDFNRGEPAVAARSRRCTTAARTTRSPCCPTAPCSPPAAARDRRHRPLEGRVPDRDLGSGHRTRGPRPRRTSGRALYHSSSLLLQDGRVLLAGGGAFAPAANESNAEIYSPPYLFKGPRPTITSAPTQLQLGQNFTVNTPDASRIQKMSLVRMGSVTHNFDMDQRFMNLSMTQSRRPTRSASTRRPTATSRPPAGTTCSSSTTRACPSVGWIVKIDPPPATPRRRPRRARSTATVQRRRRPLNWNAATDNVGGDPVPRAPVHDRGLHAHAPATGSRPSRGTSATPTTTWRRAPTTTSVVAADAAGNAGPSSHEANATVTGRHDGARPCRSRRRPPAPPWAPRST